jgi:uncharacterized protein (TIGR02597 family)
MKSIYSYALLGALFAVGALNAATTTTTPVGYTTSTLAAGKYNLVGLTLNKSAEITGTLAATQATSGSLVATGANYAVEITSAGATSGHVFEVPGSSFNDTTDTIAVGLADTTAYASATYKIRKLSTIADVFGTANSAGLQAGASTTLADVLFIPTATGFDQYFYSNGGFFGTGWRKAGASSADQASVPLSYLDGFYVFRRAATPLTLTVTGEVKTTDTSLPLSTGYNYVSSVYPVGLTLGNSGLSTSLTQGASTTVADVVYVPTAAGGFDQYFYSNGGFFGTGWRKAGAASADQATVALPSGYLVQRRGAATNAKVTQPYGTSL